MGWLTYILHVKVLEKDIFNKATTTASLEIYAFS